MPGHTIKSNRYNEQVGIRIALAKHDIEAIRSHQRIIKFPDLSHIPGSEGLPIVGSSIPMLINLHRWLNHKHAKYGNVFRAKIPTLNGVMLLGPDANKLVFQNEGKMFSNHLAWEKSFRNLFDNNLLERDFDDHKSLRKTLQVAFKREAIEGHMELMNPLLKKGIESWPANKTIKSMDYVKELLLSTGSNVFFGIEPGPELKKINQAFNDLVNGTADLLHMELIWFSPYARGIRARRFLSKFIFHNISKHRKQKTRDLFSHVCNLRDDQGNYIDDEAIRDQMLFVLFAAHDTTTSAISAILYALASNSRWQQELREEMCSLQKETVEFEDLDKLQKTDWSIKEALRMYPALPIIPRFALEPFDFEGYHIPANTPVIVSPLFTHYMPKYWSNPNHFDPLRFSPERSEEKNHFFQYVPFGGGAHKCLGLHFAQVQIKIFLFHLLRNYQIYKNSNMTRYKFNSLPLTFPSDGLPLKFSRIYS